MNYPVAELRDISPRLTSFVISLLYSKLLKFNLSSIYELPTEYGTVFRCMMVYYLWFIFSKYLF